MWPGDDKQNQFWKLLQGRVIAQREHITGLLPPRRDHMAAQCPDLAVRTAPEARKLRRPADQPAARYRLKRRLTVIAPSLADVVLYAGGRLFDLVTGGWDGVVLTADHADPRPLRIL